MVGIISAKNLKAVMSSTQPAQGTPGSAFGDVMMRPNTASGADGIVLQDD